MTTSHIDRAAHVGGPASSSQAVVVRTHKQAVYEALRDMIIELVLPPGARLVESVLAARLGVSKTPIREAINGLESDGFVEIVPYRGATVTWLSVTEMEDVRFLIDTIELGVLPRVASLITKDRIAAIARIVRQLKAARAAHDGRQFRDLTVEYHRLLFEPAGYRRLLRSITTLVFPIGLRYDRVFSQNFDDSWDLQLAIMTTRFDGVKRRDIDTTREAILAMREQLDMLNRSRLSHPLVAPHFDPDPVRDPHGGDSVPPEALAR